MLDTSCSKCRWTHWSKDKLAESWVWHQTPKLQTIRHLSYILLEIPLLFPLIPSTNFCGMWYIWHLHPVEMVCRPITVTKHKNKKTTFQRLHLSLSSETDVMCDDIIGQCVYINADLTEPNLCCPDNDQWKSSGWTLTTHHAEGFLTWT
jgi:hypothetical protein